MATPGASATTTPTAAAGTAAAAAAPATNLAPAAALPGGDAEMMDELVEAENKLLHLLNSAVTMLRTILNKVSIASNSGKGDQPLDSLSKEYVQAVERIQEILVSMLTGQNERLTFRPFMRSCYGHLLDLAATADGVNLVHDQLADLKATLTALRVEADAAGSAPTLEPVPE